MSDVEPIRRSVTVRCKPDRAFRVFTDEMTTWWPLDVHARAVYDFEGEGVKAERVEVQGHVGGQILEHMSNGEALPWGEILAWEPPTLFVMAWKPHARPDPPTEVEIRFTPDGAGTLVELEHRGWERLGPKAVEAMEGYAEGWVQTMDLFAAAIEREVA